MSRILTALEKDQAQGSLLGTPKTKAQMLFMYYWEGREQ